jgi:hypothetical protein
MSFSSSILGEVLTFSFNCPLIDSVEFLHVKGKDNENGGGWGRWITLLGTGIILWDGCSFIFQLAAIFENTYFHFCYLQLFEYILLTE